MYFLSKGPKYTAIEFSSTDEVDFRYETETVHIFGSNLDFIILKLPVSSL